MVQNLDILCKEFADHPLQWNIYDVWKIGSGVGVAVLDFVPIFMKLCGFDFHQISIMMNLAIKNGQ